MFARRPAQNMCGVAAWAHVFLFSLLTAQPRFTFPLGLAPRCWRRRVKASADGRQARAPARRRGSDADRSSCCSARRPPAARAPRKSAATPLAPASLDCVLFSNVLIQQSPSSRPLLASAGRAFRAAGPGRQAPRAPCSRLITAPSWAPWSARGPRCTVSARAAPRRGALTLSADLCCSSAPLRAQPGSVKVRRGRRSGAHPGCWPRRAPARTNAASPARAARSAAAADLRLARPEPPLIAPAPRPPPPPRRARALAVVLRALQLPGGGDARRRRLEPGVQLPVRAAAARDRPGSAVPSL